LNVKIGGVDCEDGIASLNRERCDRVEQFVKIHGFDMHNGFQLPDGLRSIEQ
jgi:hypothetical protein